MTREEIEQKLKETVVSSLDLEDLSPEEIEAERSPRGNYGQP